MADEHGNKRNRVNGDGFERKKDVGGAAHLGESAGEIKGLGDAGAGQKNRKTRSESMACAQRPDVVRRGGRFWQLRLPVPMAILARTKSRFDSRAQSGVPATMATRRRRPSSSGHGGLWEGRGRRWEGERRVAAAPRGERS